MDPNAAAAMMGMMGGAPMPFFGAGAMPANPTMSQYNNLFKTSLCKHFEISGKCSIGNKCHFAHGKHELRTKDDVRKVTSKIL